jgi:hypothetical protein
MPQDTPRATRWDEVAIDEARVQHGQVGLDLRQCRLRSPTLAAGRCPARQHARRRVHEVGALAWLEANGWQIAHGPDIIRDMPAVALQEHDHGALADVYMLELRETHR